MPHPDAEAVPVMKKLSSDQQAALLVACPVCEAEPNKACCSLAKRWQAERCRTAGIGMNGWRMTPHKKRMLVAQEALKL